LVYEFILEMQMKVSLIRTQEDTDKNTKNPNIP